MRNDFLCQLELIKLEFYLNSKVAFSEHWLRIKDKTSTVLRAHFFNLKKLIYFNWRLIILKYCSGFLPYIDMNQPLVYMCSPSWTPLPAPSQSNPSGSPQCTSPEHPVSCIKPRLAIYFTYGNIRVSMLFLRAHF